MSEIKILTFLAGLHTSRKLSPKIQIDSSKLTLLIL